MGLRDALVGFAAQAPIPVFPLPGVGFGDAFDIVEADVRIRLVTSPRSANVLLLAGELSPGLLGAGSRVHDQMSHPRMSVWWSRGAPTRRLSRLFPDLSIVEADSSPVEVIVEAHTALLHGRRPSEVAILPDLEPAPWRGVGPYGQGGKGMTGGVPYGRPMAERAADRDGLELDQLHVRVGPFFHSFPPGLTLDVRLQGDLVQDVVVVRGPVARESGPRGALGTRGGGPIPIRNLEVYRARHHLRWLAHFLSVAGLASLSDRTRHLARDIGPDTLPSVRRLRRMLERPGALGWSTADIAPLPRAVAEAAGGPVGRASGVLADARSDDPAYRDLGFEPSLHSEGDARARWRQRLSEAVQALELAERCGSRRAGENGVPVEGPRGALTGPNRYDPQVLADGLPALLVGLDWGTAVTAVASLDLGSASP